jgi:hypothetical protein
MHFPCPFLQYFAEAKMRLGYWYPALVCMLLLPHCSSIPECLDTAALVESGMVSIASLSMKWVQQFCQKARNLDFYAAIWRRFFVWKVEFIVAETGRWSVMRK